MIILTVTATENGSIVFSCAFKDEDSAVVTPNNVKWTLSDTNGTVINSRSWVVETPATTVNILLSGADLAVSEDAYRVLTVFYDYDSSYGTDIPQYLEYRFNVANLVNKQ